MEGFRIDLKTFLGLANTVWLLENSCYRVTFLGQNPLTSMILIDYFCLLYRCQAQSIVGESINH